MAAINLAYNNQEFSLGITKFDRKKVYGYTAVQVTDDQGSNCGLATISEDGMHILSKGCVGYTYLNEKNEYVASRSIKVVNEEGEILEKIPSSFDLDKIELEASSLDDFFKLAVKSVYQLNPADEEVDFSALIAVLEKETVLKFKFNYRSDYDADEAFLIHKDESVFMVIGQISPFEFIGLENTVVEDVVEEEEEEDFDFGML